MKVALISSHSFLNPGGVKKHILGLHDELKRRGISSKIIVPRRNQSERYGKDIILLGTSFPVTFGGAKGDLPVNFNPVAVEEVLARENFDILHFHNFILPSALQILLSPAAQKALAILTFHSSMEGSRLYKDFPELFYPVKKVIEWKIDGIIGVAPFILTKYFDDYQKPKIHIPNGVDLRQFQPRAAKNAQLAKDKNIKILFLGRLDKRKGLIYLLQAFKQLTKKYGNLSLVIVGDGPERSKCQEWILKNNLLNVTFAGMVDEKMTASYYRACDIYCSPAISGESFGIVLIEAMGCGLPVVAFANEGYRQVLGSGFGAEYLAKLKNWRELSKKIAILVENEALRKKLGAWGIKEAQNYSWPKVADRILDFYDSCAKFKKEKQS